MTLTGAIKQLHELRSAEDMPIHYKPVIAEVINVLLMDTQEVKHGRWIWYPEICAYSCSECHKYQYGNTLDVLDGTYRYCPNCGARMDEVEE